MDTQRNLKVSISGRSVDVRTSGNFAIPLQNGLNMLQVMTSDLSTGDEDGVVALIYLPGNPLYTKKIFRRSRNQKPGPTI